MFAISNVDHGCHFNKDQGNVLIWRWKFFRMNEYSSISAPKPVNSNLKTSKIKSKPLIPADNYRMQSAVVDGQAVRCFERRKKIASKRATENWNESSYCNNSNKNESQSTHTHMLIIIASNARDLGPLPMARGGSCMTCETELGCTKEWGHFFLA